MKWIKSLGNMLIPTVLFYIAYHAAGIIPAVILSVAYSLIYAVFSKIKNGVIRNSQIVGILGLAGSAVAILFTGEEKLYYVPAMIQNTFFLGFIAVLSVRRKSVHHYMAKNIEIASLEQVQRK